MKNVQKISALLLAVFFIAVSCQKEEIISNTNSNDDNTVVANSKAADLIKRVASKDGSGDNIIDNANCITINLPVTVVVNGLEIIVDSEEDFEVIEDIFEEFEDDDDSLEIIFPIQIILNDFSEITINNQDELEDFIDDCNDEDEEDEDLECIDFIYPIEVSVFNTLTEVVEDKTINNDQELYNLIDDLDENEALNLVFPINLLLSDGSEVQANSLSFLENLIEDSEDDCDEDDDFDFDDDDCKSCRIDQLEDLLTGCQNWFIDKFESNDNDLEDNFDGYTFNFLNDGTITINDGSGSFSGSWSAQGNGLNLIVTLNVPDFNEFNRGWKLHEIEEDDDDEKKVDLRMPNGDRLRFESNCN